MLPRPVDKRLAVDRQGEDDLQPGGVVLEPQAATMQPRHGGDKAYYMPLADRIQLPPLATFHEPGGYYATRGHETVH